MSLFLIAIAPLAAFLVLYAILKLAQRRSFTPYQQISPLSDVPDLTHLNLLQMNVFWRPKLLHLFKEEYVAERSRFLAERLAEFDIACFNEAFHFGSDVVSNFVFQMFQNGFKYVVSSRHVPLLSHHVIDSGLLILSKYPIIATDSVVYKEGCSFDRFAAKGAVYAKVQIGTRRFVHVFATHLQASYHVVTPVDFGVRVRQSATLRDFIASKIGTGDSPIFLLGDMNIDATGETTEYQRLMKTLSVDGYELIDTLREKGHPVTMAAGPEGKVPTEALLTQKSDWNRPTSIDYVFIYRKQGSRLEYDAMIEKFPISNRPYQQLSDHLAVRCAVDLAE
jgi:sphingomyelin phosphodiesterase